LSVSEIGNNVTEFCTLIMLAVGETFVIATGGIDLSVASTAEFAGIVAAFGMEHQTSHSQAFIIALGTVIALLTGAFVGLINAVLINVLRLVPFVATLVTLGAGAGMCLVLSGGSPVDNDINAIIMTRPLLGPFSWPAMIIIAITIISGFYRHRLEPICRPGRRYQRHPSYLLGVHTLGHFGRPHGHVPVHAAGVRFPDIC
jgi:ribose transport system permease protein